MFSTDAIFPTYFDPLVAKSTGMDGLPGGQLRAGTCLICSVSQAFKQLPAYSRGSHRSVEWTRQTWTQHHEVCWPFNSCGKLLHQLASQTGHQTKLGAWGPKGDKHMLSASSLKRAGKAKASRRKDPGENGKRQLIPGWYRKKNTQTWGRMKIRTELWGTEVNAVPWAFFSSRWRKGKFVWLPGESGQERGPPSYKRVNS